MALLAEACRVRGLATSGASSSSQGLLNRPAGPTAAFVGSTNSAKKHTSIASGLLSPSPFASPSSPSSLSSARCLQSCCFFTKSIPLPRSPPNVQRAVRVTKEGQARRKPSLHPRCSLMGDSSSAVETEEASLHVGQATLSESSAATSAAESSAATSAAESSAATSAAGSRSKQRGLATELLHFKGVGLNGDEAYGAVSTPIFQTATFRQPSATEGGPYDYTRSGNPTRDALQSLLAKLEGASRAFVFSSGMAAMATVTRLLSAGDVILAGDDIYGGTDRLLSRVVPRSGVVVRRVDTSNLSAFEAALCPKTKLVVMESPTNPRMVVSDIKAIAALSHAAGALLVIDNSIMSPILSKPLDLGADIVMHSATKFISGHSDVMAGVLAVREESLASEIAFLQNAEGTGLAPFDSWLALRGVKTMALRVEKQQASALCIAEFLSSHPRVTRVNYAGLPSHPGHALHMSQCKGGGSVLSFTTGSLATSKHVVESLELASIVVSFGSVSTTVSLPCFMSHASIPADVRTERGLVEDLVRLSVGLEDVDDLIDDLRQALDCAP